MDISGTFALWYSLLNPAADWLKIRPFHMAFIFFFLEEQETEHHILPNKQEAEKVRAPRQWHNKSINILTQVDLLFLELELVPYTVFPPLF